MADTEVLGDTTEKMSTEDLTTEDTTPADTTNMDTTVADDTPKEDITEEDTQPSKTVKEELVKEETEELKPDSVVQETVDENGDVFEETTQVTRKVVKRTMKITETSSSTKTTTMTTPAKLYGKDLSEYDEVDVDALLAQLSPEEINILAKEVDPDDNFLPPNQRCSYECTKDPTGPLNRKKLIEHINKEAMETPDVPENEPYVKGTVRGKKWIPPPRDEREVQADEQIAIDMGEEYEHALSDATQEEIIDLAAILGFHSMMNQDQYHASLLNKGQPVGMGWDGITKSTQQKLYPMDPPNNTDVEESIKRVKDDDPKLIELNLNNIKNISDEKFEQLFDALPSNEHLEVLSLTNVGLTDKTALLLAEAIEKSKTLRVLNVETNFINPPVVVTLVRALLKANTIEEFRASNQRSTVLGNKIEMEITDLVEKNTSLLRLGLHLEFNDARHRVAAHLQRNIDRNEHELRKGTSPSPIPNATSADKAKSPKPMHIVLTPQERIDSKSELIASLASQKLSDRGRGEISLPVPQLSGGPRSPSQERKIQPKPKAVSPISKKIEPAVEETKTQPIEKVEQKQISPVRHQESKIQPETKVASPITIEVKPAVEEHAAQPIEKVEQKQISPVRHPKIGELRKSNLSKAIDDESTVISQNGGVHEESIGQKPVSVADKEIKIESTDLHEANVSQSSDPRLPEPKPDLKVEKATENLKPLDQTKDQKIEDLSIDRNRLSESISPSRHLENNMTLLQAKIDSFAEVADEKLSNLRSRFDGLARDSTLTQNPEPSLSQTLKTTVSVPTSPPKDVKAIDKIPEPTEPVTLPPKAPAKAIKPLVKTPNSVGISFVYQKQIFKRPAIPSAGSISQIGTTDQSKVEYSQSSIEKIKITTTSEEVTSKITEALESAKIPEVRAKETAHIDRAKSERIDSNSKIEKPVSSAEIAQVKVNPKAMEVVDNVSAKIDSEIVPPKATPSSDNPNFEPLSNPEKTNPVDPPRVATINSETTALSLLSVKKGDALRIDPVNKIEVGTQSAAQPSLLSRLSVKRGDPQRIDPISKTEVGTQSPAKPNPLSRLTIKRVDLVDIRPAVQSEICIQTDLKSPTTEVASQTIDEEPVEASEEATQTPLVFSSLEHDYVFPGLRRVPYLPRPKTINIGGGDRVIVKPSSKPINEVLMLLYPAFQDYRTVKPEEDPSSSKSFGLEEDIVKDRVPESTIQDLEETMQNATETSESILNAEPINDLIEEVEEVPPVTIRTEIEIPLNNEPQSVVENIVEDRATEAHYESEYTAVEEVQALSRTTIASEAHVQVIDKAYKSMAAVSTSEEEHVSKTSIKSANMWESLSSNLLKASEQTLIDISKAAEMRDGRTKIGKVSVYSSIEDLSHSSRSNYSDRRIGGLIKTVEKTSVYSSLEDLPVTAYTRYSDRYGDARIKTVTTTSIYSSNEDLPRSKYSDRDASDLLRTATKTSAYSSLEDLLETPYTKYSDRYSGKKNIRNVPALSPDEDDSLLPPSKFLDRHKTDHVTAAESHQLQSKIAHSQEFLQTSTKTGRSLYKSSILDHHSIGHSQSSSLYNSSEDLSYKTKYADRYASTSQHKTSDILSSISRNESAMKRYTYVPKSVYSNSDLIATDRIRSRPSSPSGVHTSILQLKVSPSGIRELSQNRVSKASKEAIDKPSRFRSGLKTSIKALSPKKTYRPSSYLLSSQRKVSDPANDEFTDKSIQSPLKISSAFAAADLDASTTTTTNTTPKKRANIMDTIKMLKNKVRDVITTEDRFSEAHRLPSSSSIQSSSTSAPSRAARTSPTATSSSLNIPHGDNEKEI